MSLSLNLPDSDSEVDFPLIRRQQQSSKSDQIAAGDASVTRPSSPRRDPTHTPRVLDGDREMRDVMRGLEGVLREIRDADKSKKPHLKLQEFSGEEDWEEFISHFELCAKLGSWTRGDQALALISSYFARGGEKVLNKFNYKLEGANRVRCPSQSTSFAIL
jgi:hypothetical protein